MAIVVDYTPYAAVARLAQQAGESQAVQRQQEYQHRRDMMMLENQLRQQNMQFAVQAEQQARAEEFMYQAKYLQMKRDIDIQIELQEYQRNRQKLNLAMETIRNSDSLTDAEKEELAIQAMAKYGEVGAGIAPSSFAAKLDPLARKYLESDLKRSKLEEIYGLLESGQISKHVAQHMAQAYGLGKLEFASPQEDFQKQIDDQTKRLADAQKRLSDSFILDGKTVLNAHTKAKVKEGTEEYALYKTLKAQRDREQKALEQLASGMAGLSAARSEFMRQVETSPSLQKAINEFGEESVFNEWRKYSTKEIQLLPEPPGRRPVYLSPTGMPMY